MKLRVATCLPAREAAGLAGEVVQRMAQGANTAEQLRSIHRLIRQQGVRRVKRLIVCVLEIEMRQGVVVIVFG